MVCHSLVNKVFFTLLFVFQVAFGITQTKVAILDFENTSGISKYDGFGKALSNMLITDLKNSIHPRKITFLERSQLNKILSEQNLQKSKNFDKSTAVSFGKLAGVKYVLVGSVYVMDGTCNITSRLVDVQTSEIVHAKESNGKITNWLSLKSILANELSTAMNNPVSIEAEYTNKETSEGVITQYAKVIDKMDEGDMEGAQEMTEMLSSVQPDFKYFDELKLDIKQLKKQVKVNTQDISSLKKSGALIFDPSNIDEYQNNLLALPYSYDKRLDIVKEVVLKYDSNKLTNLMFNWTTIDLDINEFYQKIENNIKYYNSLSSQRKKVLFLYYLNGESFSMMQKLNWDVNVTDEVVVKSVKTYIKVQKLFYQTFSSPLLENEFIFLKLSQFEFYNRGILNVNTLAKNSRRIINLEEFKRLKISVMNNMFNSQKNEDGIDSEVINYLQKFYSNGYYEIHGFSESSSENSYFLSTYYLKTILDYNIYNRIDGKNKNILMLSSKGVLNLTLSKPGDILINEAIKELNFPFLYLNGQKITTTFNKKISDKSAIENFVSKTPIEHASQIKVLYNLSYEKVLTQNDFKQFKTIVKNYIQRKKKIYFDYQLHNHPNDELYLKKFKKFSDYNEFLNYFNSNVYPEVKYDYDNYLICDFLPTGTHVVFSKNSSEYQEYIVVNSEGNLIDKQIAVYNEPFKISENNYLVVDHPKYDILDLTPSHFSFIDLHSDSRMHFDIYHANRHIMQSHEDYFWGYKSEHDSLNISRIEALLTYLELKNKEKLKEIEELFPSKHQEYLKEQIRLENLLKETNSYFYKLFDFATVDTSLFFNLSNNELVEIYSWRNGLTKLQTDNGYAKRRVSNYELYEFFNTAFEELVSTEKEVSRERLSRAIIYNSIVFDFFYNIKENIVFKSNYKKNKLKILLVGGRVIEIDVEEFKNASRINTAHAFLVYSFNYEKSLYKIALKLYKKNIKYKFGENFMNLSSKEVIKSDLNDFVEKGLIDKLTKEKVISELGL